MGEGAAWRWPIAEPHRTAAHAGNLVFVGGAGPYDGDGAIVGTDSRDAQIERALRNIGSALAAEGVGLDDILRLKAFYTGADEADHWRVVARLRAAFAGEVAPAITANPVVFSTYPGQAIQLQAIAAPGWRAASNLDFVTSAVPARFAGLFETPVLTQGLRAGEMVVVAGQTATGDDGAVLAPGQGIEQTHIIMSRAEEILQALGASFQDCVKKEGYYFGTTIEEWAEMAAVRASYFRDPAAVATVVPCQVLYPEGLVTKVEFLAMRTLGNKYIPRGDSWPESNWDWPIPVPYRQGIRLHEMIWVGGQVAFAPGSNDGSVPSPGALMPQTGETMDFIAAILAGFGKGPDDIRFLVTYFASDGTAAATNAFIATLARAFTGPLPPMTVVPLPRLHSDEMTVEIWAVAVA